MIKVGILGSGYIAETHANSIHAITETELIGVAGGSRSEAFAKKHNIQNYTGIEKLLSDPGIDAVIICTPHGLHKEEAIAAANNRKSVFLEKPMALNSTECQQIIEVTEKNNVTLIIGHSQRYFPTNIKVHELLETGYFGKPLVIRSSQLGAGLELKSLPKNHWALDEKLGGSGTTLGYGIHNLDKVLWWINEEPDLIYGTFRKGGMNKEVGSFINFTTKSGVDVSTMFQGDLNGKLFDHQRDCAEIICEKGHIECQTYRQVRICSADGEWSTILEMDFRKERSSIYKNIMQDFIDAINNKKEVTVTGEDGLKAVKLVDLAHRSYTNKEIVSWHQE